MSLHSRVRHYTNNNNNNNNCLKSNIDKHTLITLTQPLKHEKYYEAFKNRLLIVCHFLNRHICTFWYQSWHILATGILLE